jgi:CheY-like chemotaxis protein/two-component sensor histidine kinase
MVDDLMDVSRIVSGKITLALESVDLREVVQRALEQTMPAMQHRTVPLKTVLPEAPVFVHGDPLRLTQIVCNLLTNAAKFTAPDRRIRLMLGIRAAQAELTVQDEGAGIPADLLPHVFDRFVQGRQPLQRASGGLGLGLAIAQSLARLHGGVIEAASEGEGQGAVFTVRLPLLAAIDGATHKVAPPGSSQQALRLLLVDDNVDALKMLAEWCTLEGHAVQTATSAEAALVLLEAEPFDAGIFDIGLPGMSGYELARQVRSAPRTQSMALVALTGYGQETAWKHALDAGFDDHFAKPADIEQVLQRLEQLARAQRRA